MVAQTSSCQVPMGAGVCVPMTVVDESETLIEQPEMVSLMEADESVESAETYVVVVQASAVCVSHSPSSSVVI